MGEPEPERQAITLDSVYTESSQYHYQTPQEVTLGRPNTFHHKSPGQEQSSEVPQLPPQHPLPSLPQPEVHSQLQQRYGTFDAVSANIDMSANTTAPLSSAALHMTSPFPAPLPHEKFYPPPHFPAPPPTTSIPHRPFLFSAPTSINMLAPITHTLTRHHTLRHREYSLHPRMRNFLPPTPSHRASPVWSFYERNRIVIERIKGRWHKRDALSEIEEEEEEDENVATSSNSSRPRPCANSEQFLGRLYARFGAHWRPKVGRGGVLIGTDYVDNVKQFAAEWRPRATVITPAMTRSTQMQKSTQRTDTTTRTDNATSGVKSIPPSTHPAVKPVVSALINHLAFLIDDFCYVGRLRVHSPPARNLSLLLFHASGSVIRLLPNLRKLQYLPPCWRMHLHLSLCSNRHQCKLQSRDWHPYLYLHPSLIPHRCHHHQRSSLHQPSL